jgi:hypothetical protein
LQVCTGHNLAGSLKLLGNGLSAGVRSSISFPQAMTVWPAGSNLGDDNRPVTRPVLVAPPTGEGMRMNE